MPANNNPYPATVDTIRYPSVSVCFPAYNEAEIIQEVLEEAYVLLRDSGLDYEILVCNDGSEDDTGRIIDSLQKRVIPGLRVFHNPVNRGMQCAFQIVYSHACKDFVFGNAVDRQWPTQCLFDLLPFTREYDLIVASRKDKHYGLFRGLVSYTYNIIPRLLFGVETYDAGATKLMRREIIERFTLVSRSPFGEAERMIRATRAGYRITHCPVDTKPRETGQATGAKPSVLLMAMLDVGRVWWTLSRGRQAHEE